MADIRCPMCGKSNPAEAETCWSCQARLKPLLPNQPAQPGGQGDAPDWLSGLRGGSGDGSGWGEPGGENEAAPGDTPDWLARIREQQQSEPAGEDTPDWLKAISGDETPAAEEPPAEAAPAEEQPDWLGALRGSEPPAPQESAPGGGEEDQDWMAGLSAWQSHGQGQDVQPPAENTAPAGDDLNWLNAFKSEDEISPEPAEPETPSAPFEPEDNWLNTLNGPAETPSEPPAQAAGDSLDWFSTLGGASETPAEEPAQPAAENTDWMSTLSFSQEAAGEIPAEPPAQPAEDLDWLATLGATPPAAETPAPEPAQTPFDETPSGEGEPDWLGQLPSQQTPEETYASDSSELSDWFSGLNLPSESSEEPPAPSGPGKAEPAAGSPFETPFGAQPASSSPFMGEEPEAQPGETPDWLKVFGESETPQPPADETAGDSVQPVMPFAGQDMPDWLGQGDESTPAENAPEETGHENLETAQLPGWLQAMRPVEAVVPQDTPPVEQDQTMEKAGPLAGMLGVVPGEDIVNKVRKPPVYSSRLHVSENQRFQAGLLEEMLSEEAKSRPASARRSHLPDRIVRLLVAVLLLVVTAVPLVTGTQIMPLPDLFPPETVNFRSQVEALPENAPVLLAVDFEPGLSEEMSLASSSVLDHLAAKKARISMLSTVPTGPVLAEQLLKSAAVRNSGFQTGDSTVNLGFLPGGTAGLQEFASRPQVALQVQLNGEPAWDTPALRGVTDIRKFAALVVLTENAETARAWIEQVQPSLGDVPLLFVISAQSAPMIHPYLDSGQVQGMVAGMYGGIAYAQIARQPVAAASYWDAYQFGLFTAVVLVILGALWSLVRSLSRRKPAQKGA